MAAPPPTVPSVLLPELLGFVPQFLLDDIINIANDSVRQAVDAMEQFLDRWATERADKQGDNWDSTEDLERGLVAFQTLLESHVDIAFDFFEAWSLRNIFAIPADLPVVAPHQAGLDLEQSPDSEREEELLREIEELRRKVYAQRQLKRLYTRAVRKSASQLLISQNRLVRLAFLRSPQLRTLLEIPPSFLDMHEAVSNLPQIDPSSTAPEHLAAPEPGKRLWETSKTGYLNWAVEQLMRRTKDQNKGEGSSAVGAAVEAAYGVGKAEDVKAFLDASAADGSGSKAAGGGAEGHMEIE